MMKNYLSFIFIGCSLIANAQNTTAPITQQKLPANRVKFTGNEFINQAQVSPNPFVGNQSNNNNSRNFSETVIGTSTYDLQSNGSVQNRSMLLPNGNFSGMWTMSLLNDAAFPDRGTGYNYGTLGNFQTAPTARLETVRSGWSSNLVFGSGAEGSISHPGVGGLTFIKRSTAGTGSWTQSTVPTSTGRTILWPRSVVGGINNETIHCFAITEPVANNGTLYQGIDGALLYWRSQDGGTTWDIQDLIIPSIDATNYIAFDGDEYSIASRGNTVVLAVFGGWKDIFILKSVDNGTTWTKTIINQFPIPFHVPDMGSDIDTDGVNDIITTSDQTGSVIIDANGMAHVFYGNMNVTDDDLTDGNTSYFPATDGLMYWNESFTTEPVVIAEALDLNGNDTLDFASTTAGEFPLYFTSQSSMASAGIAANGTIYCTYSSMVETSDNGNNQNYRHIYVIKSSDNGATWSAPVDITSEDEFAECVFGSTAPIVDGYIHLAYMRDSEPGLAVRGDEDLIFMNEIVYLKVDTTNLFSVGINEKGNINNNLSIYPNPASSNVFINLKGAANTNTIVTVFDINGKSVLNKNLNLGIGQNELNINSLKAGIYFVNVQNEMNNYTQKLIVK